MCLSRIHDLRGHLFEGGYLLDFLLLRGVIEGALDRSISAVHYSTHSFEEVN